MQDSAPAETAQLDFETRSKSRLLLRLDSGGLAAVIVERGRVLRDGDQVRAADGRLVRIIAAEESLLEASATDPLLIVRAAYHLGNRHVAVQVTANRLRFLNDRVLGEMVRGLGLEVTAVRAPFEPEGGAYGHHAHGGQAPLMRPKIHEFLQP
jgi:urease accessory protein